MFYNVGPISAVQQCKSVIMLYGTRASVVKNPPAKARDIRAVETIPGFLPGQSHGQRNLMGYSP